MKKVVKLSILLMILFLFGITNVYASSGALKKDSIIKCPDGLYYGQHGSDNHWHEAERSNTWSSWTAVGDIIPGDDPCNRYSVLPFKDVKTYEWFYEPIKEAYLGNIISGYSSTRFAPRDKVTRGQLVTILWRLEGQPIVNQNSKFSDVKSGEYYTNAVNWASANHIVNGYGTTGKFGPGNPIIRQDLAVILNNYARHKGLDSITGSKLNTFVDYNKIRGNYAEDALKWAVKYKVISGRKLTNGSKAIDPFNKTTRAEAAAMIINFKNTMSTIPKESEVQDTEVTTRKLQAVNTAREYLNQYPFSRKQLIEYLEDAGYTYAEALYGINNCGVVFLYQAVRAAQDAVDNSFYSKEGLKKYLLEEEEFTEEEADYGIKHSGANWNQEAVEAAQEYNNAYPLSLEMTKDVLMEYELFTEEEALYGVTNCGLDWNTQAVESLKLIAGYETLTDAELINTLEELKFTHEESLYAVEQVKGTN